MPLSRRLNAKNLVTLVVLLVLAGVPTSSLAYFHSSGSHSLNPAQVKQPSTAPDPQLGFDCGVGTTLAVLNGTSFPVAPSENGAFEIVPSCTWIGDAGQTATAANDGTTEPLVTDQDELLSTISPAIGGGFTADVVYLQNATSTTNGFDITINWNPKVIQLAKFEQAGLLWNSNNPFTGVFALDNTVGQLHVVQVTFAAFGGDWVFFRLRFDVVGVGNSGLTISNDVITNPGAVVHQTFNGAFDAESFFDPGHTLNWVASFTNSTPIIPGSTNNFLATVTGGTGTYTYAWDLNSDGTIDSTTNPASLIIPTATLTAHRIRLTVTDSSSNVISLSEKLPLTVFVHGPQGLTTTSVGTANTFTGDWLGGIPPYTGSWRFCPGGILASVDCNRPAPTIASTTGQISTQTGTTAITYTRAGVYTNTLKITDTGSPVLPGGGASVTYTYLVNVTGTPQAYTLTLATSPTTTTVGQSVQYTVTAAYSSGYTPSLRSSTISVKFLFGDGSSATSTIAMALGGANTTSVSHSYIAANASPGYTVLVVGQETAANAISLIQEVSNRITETINKRSTLTTVSCSPGSVTVGTLSTCTTTVSDSSPGTSTVPGGTVSFASDGAGNFNSPNCTLVAPATGPPSCSVDYTPTAAGTGTHTITGTYNGDLTHATSQGTGTVLVSSGLPTVTVNPPTPNPTNTGTMVTVTFSVSSTTTVTGITVAWGDGSTDTLAATATSDTHTYSSTGALKSEIFTITVTATSAAGPGSGTATETINDRIPVVTAPSISPNPANTGVLVTASFTANDPDGTISSITVDWGDGTPIDTLGGTATSDTHTYLAANTFTVTVIATDNSGSTGQNTGSVVVQTPVSVPTVTVNAPTPNPANTGVLVTVTFTVSSTAAVTSITVNWGDGTTNTLAVTATSDTHAYTSTGATASKVFTITVTATNSAGPGSGTTSETVNDRAPTVTISTISPNPANTGQLVTLSFSATDPDGTVSTITINWGDASTPTSLAGTATSATHTYTSTGTAKSQVFSITVTATDNSGSIGIGLSSETVNDLPPVVSVTNVSPNPVNTGVLVTATFTATDPDGTVSSISVNWGDGTAADTLAGTVTTDTHTYNVAGPFTITVTATDNSGSTGSGTGSITVNAIGVPTVTVNSPTPNPANTGQTVTVTFTVSSTATVTGLTVNWGDGTTNTLAVTAPSDTHIYASTGTAKSQTFTITVTATNSAGPGSGTTTEAVNDLPPAVTVSNVSPNPANTGQLVTVTFSSTDPDGTVSSITVSWGDGSAVDTLGGSATSDTHTYSTASTFTITVTATDNSGSTGQATGSVTTVVPVGAPTVTVNNPTPNPADTGTTVSVTFTVSSTATVTGITVNWGDGTTNSLAGTAVSDTHIYSSTDALKSQTFTITVTATNSAGPGSGTTTETVNDQPPTVSIVSISPNPVNTGVLVTVTFTATDPDGTISSINVDWGDATTPDVLAGTATSDTHTYTSPGSFTITVTATDNSGSTGQATGSITVNAVVGVPTVTVNSPTPNPADTGQMITVTFTVTSTATVTGISVNWGDGTTPDSLAGTATSDTHIYSSTGNAKSQSFTITVTATNTAGPGSGTTTEMVNDRPPVSSFTFNPTNPSAGQTVSFDATGSADPDGTITNYAWDFGDGTSGTGATPTHAYNPASTMSFTVMLTVTDNSGNTGSSSQSVTVIVTAVSPPTVSITNVSPNPASTGQMVTLTFTVSSTATVTGITVNWGDGTTLDSQPGTATSDTHSYANTGNAMSQAFTITVTATNIGGPGTATTTERVNDRSPLVTISTVTPNPANTGVLVTVTFTDTDPDGTVSSISVNWGDSTTPDSLAGSATSDTHSYASPGSFTITVTATDNSGSAGSATATETVMTVTTTPVKLIFMALAPHSPQVGPGQLQVFVNGVHVADVTPGLTSFVSLGPFDITGFLNGQTQNNVTFVNPQTSQFVLVKNVNITQGSVTLLHVSNVRIIAAGRSLTFTFSVPPLLISSLSVSSPSPSTDQLVTFTASFTGGTAPFLCVFRFGDEESSSVLSSSGTCSVTHDFDYSGSFHTRVVIKGSSTSDIARENLTVNVGQTETDDD